MGRDLRIERRLLLAAVFSLVATTLISLFLVHPIQDEFWGRSRYSILPWLPLSTIVVALNVAAAVHLKLARRLGTVGVLVIVAVFLPLVALGAALTVQDDHRIQNEAADVFDEHVRRMGAGDLSDRLIADRSGEDVTMCGRRGESGALCLEIDVGNPRGHEVEGSYEARTVED
jgi:hypothetical protein